MNAYRIGDNPPLTLAIVLTDEFWAMVGPNVPDGALLPASARRGRRDRPKSGIRANHGRQLIDIAKHRGADFLSDRIFERSDGRLVAVTE
ncbi:hypothetical protein [Rhizobium leguminosarum]|uniref:Uncharacterized protein n=1 Tax=Rhizobium leguminosarum TaxID=384 RepID=A0A2K9YY74_RHILE|nr:hypothetical protein [Rhizobium leguminosarum]AUW40938.1 hypothetical protein CUJ84_Chr000531 [Rhizobium leguminosarum]